MGMRIAAASASLIIAMISAIAPAAAADDVSAAPAAAQITFSYGAATGPWYTDVRVGDGGANSNQGSLQFNTNAPVAESVVPTVAVTVGGLDAGTQYCANLNHLPGADVWFSDTYNYGCATAGADGQAAFTIHLVGGATDWSYLKDAVSNGHIRLYAHVARQSDIVNGLGRPIAGDSTGTAIPVSSISSLASLSDVRLDTTAADGKVTAQYTYRIDPSLKDRISTICVAFDAFRATSMTLVNSERATDEYLETFDPFTDEAAYCAGDGTAAHAKNTAGSGTLTAIDTKRNNITIPVADYTYQRTWFTTEGDFATTFGQRLSANMRATVQGYDRSLTYDNHGGTLESAARALAYTKQTSASQPMSSLRASLQLRFKDGTMYVGEYDPFLMNANPRTTFSDVDASTPHAGDIAWLARTGVTSGYPDGTFGGMRTVVRQDMAAFLYRLAGSPAFDVGAVRNPFRDVNPGTPHYKEILWLYSAGIAQGYPDGTFGGMRTVVRQDMAAFLDRFAYRYGGKWSNGVAVTFTDVNSSTPHADDIAWLARTGVTAGYADGTFGGMRDVVRQDMAAFLHRMNVNVLR